MCALLVNGYSLKPHCAVGFSWDLSRQKISRRPEQNTNEGTLSEKSKSRLRNAINWMQYLSEGKFYYDKTTKKKYPLRLNFITLNLCAKQFHSDEFIYHRLVRPFLRWLKRKGLTLYVWRAESQANGNIHFHITGNKFVDRHSIQLKWNSLLQEHGYIRAYIQNGGDGNPPSTHVKGIKQPHKLAAYLVKYMSKNDKDRRKITCKLWGCSAELSNQRRNISELDLYFKEMKELLSYNCERKVMNDHFILIYNSQTIRNHAMKLQYNANHKSPVILLRERAESKRLPCKLGKYSKAYKVARRIHMPTLWSETKRVEERQETLLPSDFKCRAFRPPADKSQRRKLDKPLSKLPLRIRPFTCRSHSDFSITHSCNKTIRRKRATIEVTKFVTTKIQHIYFCCSL